MCLQVMKTTIDIPESLYKKAKIRAVEQETTLKELMLDALEQSFQARVADKKKRKKKPYWARRKLLPKYRALLASGSLRGGTDSSVGISEERDAR